MATFPLNFWYRGAPIGDARAGASTDFGLAYRGNVGQVVGKSLATLVSVASTDVFAASDRHALSASLQSLEPLAASERSSLAASAQDRDSASLADLASSLASVVSTDSITARDVATVSVLILSADSFAASDLGLWTLAATTTSIVSADAFAFTDGLKPTTSGTSSLVVDAFTGTAGTALTSHAPDAGGSWSTHPFYQFGAGQLTGANRARFLSISFGTSGAAYWSGTPSSADYAVAADLYVANTNGAAGVAARFNTSANTLVYARYDSSTGVLSVGHINSGTDTSLASTTLSWSTASTHNVSLAVSGSSATVAVDGAPTLGPVTVTPSAAGKAGILLTGTSSSTDSDLVHLDNFAVSGFSSTPPPTGISPEFITLLAGEGFAAFESLGTLLAASRSIDLASAWDSSSLAASVASRESWAFLDAGSVLLSGPLLIVSSDGFGFADLLTLGASLAGVDPAGLADGSVVSASLASSDLASFAQLSAPLLYLITARDPFGFVDRSGGFSASIADSDPINGFVEGFGVSVSVGASDAFASGDRGISSLIMADVPITGMDRAAFFDRAAITVRVSGLDPIAFFDLSTLGVSISSADALAFVETGLWSLAPLGVFSMDSARFGEAIDLEASIGDLDPWSFLDSTAIGVGVSSLDAFSASESAFLALSVSSCDAFAWRDAGAVSVFTATLNYHIYANDGAGGPINYASAVATTAGLSWSSGPLAAGGDYWWGVRAYSLATGLEEQNLDAAVEVILDAAWADVTARPAPPTSLRASALAGGVVRVEWSDRRPAGVSRATGYRVYKGVGSVDWATVAADVPATAGIAGSYSVKLGPLTDGTVYMFGVRAYNATASESNTTSVSATADATGPAAVDGFAVTLTSES